jgi:nucleoside-diphosphate-sugar epimerase
VVYHCAAPAYTQWTTTFPKMNSAIISALACSNARLVALDNLYAYGRSGTLHEQLPYAAEGPKGKLRAQLADQFMDAHKREGLQLTIARSSDFLGPKVRVSAVGERFWPQLLRGKSVSWFGQLGVPHTYTYVPDLARAMIRLGEEEAAVGKIWHVPSLPSINVEDLATRAASLANVTAPKVKPVSALMMGFIGLFVPVVKELREVRYQFDNPFQMSWAAYGEAFGAEATEFDAALQATIGWWQDELRAV